MALERLLSREWTGPDQVAVGGGGGGRDAVRSDWRRGCRYTCDTDKHSPGRVNSYVSMTLVNPDFLKRIFSPESVSQF